MKQTTASSPGVEPDERLGGGDWSLANPVHEFDEFKCGTLEVLASLRPTNSIR